MKAVDVFLMIIITIFCFFMIACEYEATNEEDSAMPNFDTLQETLGTEPPSLITEKTGGEKETIVVALGTEAKETDSVVTQKTDTTASVTAGIVEVESDNTEIISGTQTEEVIAPEAITTWVSEKMTEDLVSSVASTEKTYLISYSGVLLENNSVGNEWSYYVKFMDDVLASGATVITENTDGPSFVLFVSEYDKNHSDDERLMVKFSDMNVGITETQTHQITVIEDDGRYKGQRAIWEFKITCQRVS